MAITPTLLTSGFDETDSVTHSTASITLPANQLVLLALHKSRAAAAPQVATATTTGATWVSIVQQAYNTSGTPRSRLSLFRTMVTSDVTGIITMANSSSHDMALWSVVAFSGVDTSGADGAGAIVQAVNGLLNSSLTWSNTLAAFGDATNNAAYQTTSTDIVTTLTPDELTQLHDVDSAVRSLWTGWVIGQTLTPSGTIGSSSDWAAIAVEIKASAEASMTPAVDDVILSSVAPVSLIDHRFTPTTA